jgi:hypothetical protein
VFHRPVPNFNDSQLFSRRCRSLCRVSSPPEPGSDPEQGVILSFCRFLRANKIRVVQLARSNGLARTISESNLRSQRLSTDIRNAHEKTLKAKLHLGLRNLQAEHGQWVMRERRYRAAFAKLEQWGIPVMHVSYERLLERPETMNAVMRFVGVDDTEVEPERGILKGPGWSHPLYATKWHTNATREYIANPEEVSAWMAEHKLPGWTECMLDDACPTKPPRFSSPDGG